MGTPYQFRSNRRGRAYGGCGSIIRFLQTKEVKAIVIACNTASACALEAVEKSLDIPIIGVISAGSRAAVEATRNGKIGIIGTEATIDREN